MMRTSEGQADSWVKQVVERTVTRKRQHASYFDHYDKEVKERAIVQDLLELLAKNGAAQARSLVRGDDPPDVYAFFSDGSEHGYEVVELVNQGAVEAQVARKPEYGPLVWTWSRERTCDMVRKIIKNKNRKCQTFRQGRANVSLSLVIHTDEDQLDLPTLRKHLGKFRLPKNKFESVFLLIGYDPMHEGINYIRLK